MHGAMHWGASGGTVVVSASGSAQASGVTDNRDGTYSATVTNTVAETVRVSATLDGAAITDTADVVFTSGDASIGVTITPESGLVTTEAGGTASFTVVLDSQPTGDVMIGLSSSDTTEGTVSLASLIFTPANWNTPQEVTVIGQNDDVVDGDQDLSIVTAATVSTDISYQGFDPVDVAVTNRDDDAAALTFAGGPLRVAEAGGTAEYTVVLISQPSGDVTVTPSSDATGNATVSGPLTFTAQNWNVAQAVTVTGVDDAIAGGDRQATISHGISGGGYDAVSADVVTVTVIDDDIAGVAVDPVAGLITTEAGGTATFTVMLESEPTAEVTIGLSSSDLSEGAVSPARLNFTSDNWSTPRTATVTGIDDDVTDGDVDYTIETAAAVSQDATYNGLDPADVFRHQ